MFIRQWRKLQLANGSDLPSRAQAGDTIVEVLIALAIVSFILVTAYAITMRNTQQLQNNAERVQAQHLAEGQLEALKGTNGLAGGTCFDTSGAPASGGACSQTTAGSGATYNISIANNGGTYAVTVIWTSIGGDANTSSIKMYYRL